MSAHPQEAYTPQSFHIVKDDLAEYHALDSQANTPAALASDKFDPFTYIQSRLGWTPWQGNAEHPGQVEILEAYRLALLQQHEREDYEQGRKQESELVHWKPGEQIKNRIRVESGDNNGKTKLAAGLVSHFFDHFAPSVVYTFAPSWDQVKRLLWKEISVDRSGKNLPGRLLDTCELKDPARKDHFAVGISTDNAGGHGREKIQGQHVRYTLVVIDEAEGIADFVYAALSNLTSGGIWIVLIIGNPMLRTSQFHKQGYLADAINFRMDTTYHPNVIAGKELIPGAASRQFVLSMLESHAQTVDKHEPDLHTFELPWQPGIIYLPDSEYLSHVKGIASASITDKNLISSGRYDAACKREPQSDNPSFASLGLDCARWGRDNGTGYTRHNGAAYRFAQFIKQDNIEYYLKTKDECKRLAALGVKKLHIRVDAGGGFGSGVVDLLKVDDELIKLFDGFLVIECNFGSTAVRDKTAYYDKITEWTADVAETLKGLAILNPPAQLEGDLCEREVEPRNVEGKFVRKLEEKDKFRKRNHRSPDDGDGFVLAVASEHLFNTQHEWNWF